jgi:hypothetical protein
MKHFLVNYWQLKRKEVEKSISEIPLKRIRRVKIIIVISNDNNNTGNQSKNKIKAEQNDTNLIHVHDYLKKIFV